MSRLDHISVLYIDPFVFYILCCMLLYIDLVHFFVYRLFDAVIDRLPQ